jgi:hypothetical protein
VKQLGAIVLFVALGARAESDTPNSYDMLGWDPVSHQLYLRDVMGDKGPWDLWTIDFKTPTEPHIFIKPLEKKNDVPEGLKLVKSVPLEEVQLSGFIRKEQLERSENRLVKRYDLRIIVEWNSSRVVTDLIAYRNPEMGLVEVYKLPPETPCAIAVVSWTAKLTGVILQRALVMCPPDKPAPGKK